MEKRIGPRVRQRSLLQPRWMVVTGKTGRAEDDGEPYKGTFKECEAVRTKTKFVC